MTRKACLALASLLAAAGTSEAQVRSAPGATCPFTVTGALEAGDLTQSARMFRSGASSTCARPQPCDGSTGTGPYLYDQYPFVNGEATSCVTVSLFSNCAAPGSFSLHASAYFFPFTPGQACMDYIADIGDSPADGEPSKSFSFEVPPGEQFVVVVNHLTAGGICPGYILNVTGCKGEPAGPSH